MRRAIARKRDGEPLAAATWHAIVAGYCGADVDDAQMAALLMACVLRGVTQDETHALVAAFVASGETFEHADLTVDKHSSGGVGDTASLIVVPLVAACGVPVAKLAGRALGHTGGTLDKLEAVDGVRVALSPQEFADCVRTAGCAIAAQSDRIVPADKRVYALRDRTSTVPAPGLIAASIVAKKIAGGAHAIAYDVKTGNGAFVRGVADARALAEMLVMLTSEFGRRSVAIVSDMNEPLGPAVGTGLEVIEARDFLRGERCDARLQSLCETLASAMLELAGHAGGAGALAAARTSGRAYETFEAMLAAQGARSGALERLAPHRTRTPVRATRGGYVAAVNCIALGEYARDLVDAGGSTAGVIVHARYGDAVEPNDALATAYGGPETGERLLQCFTI